MKRKFKLAVLLSVVAMFEMACPGRGPMGPGPNPNNPNTGTTATSINQASWLVASAPEPVAFLGGTTYDAGPDSNNNRTRFYNPGAPNANMVIFQTIGTQNTGSINYTNVPAYGGPTYAQTGQANDAVQVLQFAYSHLTNQRWAGLRQVLSENGTDFSKVASVMASIYNDGNDKWIMVDFGVMSEASNGDISAGPGDPFFSDPNQYALPLRTADPVYGLPTFYYQGNPWSAGGSSTSPVSYLFPDEMSSQEGVSVGYGTNYVTEDVNGNGQLDTGDHYFEYGIRANWNGWRQVDIPFNPTAADNAASEPDGTSYFFHTQGLANPSVIREVRLWTTGSSSSEICGDFYFENISFIRNP